MIIVNPESTKNIIETQPTQLVHIESEIKQISVMLRKGWLFIGIKLLTVEKNKLYEQHNIKTFTSWLKALSKSLELKPSTLWKYLKIVRMIDDINLPFSEVNLKNVTGLEVISRIHEFKGNVTETLDLINQLDEKNITVTELRHVVINLKNTELESDNDTKQVGLLKRCWRSIKCFLKCMPPTPVLRVLPVLFVVFYITDMS